MKVILRNLNLSALLIFIILTFTACIAEAKTYENEWADINYSACEGVGLSSSGRVRVRIEYESAPRGFEISSFQLFTTHPRGSFPAATLEYEDPRGQNQKLQLTRPWFPTIGEQNVGHLLLPRVRTSQSVGSLREQMAIRVSSRQNLTITLILLVDGFPACSTGFSKSFRLQP